MFYSYQIEGGFVPMKHCRAQLALAATLLTLSLPHLYAQTSRGTVSGLLTDPTTGAVPGATVGRDTPRPE